MYIQDNLDPFPKVHFLAKSLQIVTIFQTTFHEYTSIIFTYITIIYLFT